MDEQICQHIWTIEDHDSNFGVPVVGSQTEKSHQFIFLVWLSLDTVCFLISMLQKDAPTFFVGT